MLLLAPRCSIVVVASGRRRRPVGIIAGEPRPGGAGWRRYSNEPAALSHIQEIFRKLAVGNGVRAALKASAEGWLWYRRTRAVTGQNRIIGILIKVFISTFPNA